MNVYCRSTLEGNYICEVIVRFAHVETHSILSFCQYLKFVWRFSDLRVNVDNQADQNRDSISFDSFTKKESQVNVFESAFVQKMFLSLCFRFR